MGKPVTAPLGAHRLAGEFLRAALATSPIPDSEVAELRQHISLVGFYLVAHSIELSLKAFLLGRGMPIGKLRSKPFGHNLVSLVTEARRRRLGLVVKLTPKDLLVLDLLNECYSVKELEYAFTGARRLPRYPLAVGVASKLLKGLQPYCRKLAANNSSKPTPLRGAA